MNRIVAGITVALMMLTACAPSPDEGVDNQTEQDAAQHGVLAPAQLRQESHVERQQGGMLPAVYEGAPAGLDDTRHDAHQRALTHPVAAYDAEGLAPVEIEGDIANRPEGLAEHAAVLLVAEADIPEGDDGMGVGRGHGVILG